MAIKKAGQRRPLKQPRARARATTTKQRHKISRKKELCYIPEDTPAMDDDFDYYEDVSVQGERVDTPTNDAPQNTGKKQRKSAKGRTLMRWSPDVDQYLLLCIDYVCSTVACDVPWNDIGSMMQPKLTSEAIKQHLAKLRKARMDNGMPVPPVIDKLQRRRAKKDAQAEIVVEPVKFQPRSGLLPPVSIQTKRKRVDEKAGIIVQPRLTTPSIVTSEASTPVATPAKPPAKTRGRKRTLAPAISTSQQIDGSRSTPDTPAKKRARPKAGFYQEVPLPSTTQAEDLPKIDPDMQQAMPYYAQQTNVAVAPMFASTFEHENAIEGRGTVSPPGLEEQDGHGDFTFPPLSPQAFGVPAPDNFQYQFNFDTPAQAVNSQHSYTDDAGVFNAAPDSGLNTQVLDTPEDMMFTTTNYSGDQSMNGIHPTDTSIVSAPAGFSNTAQSSMSNVGQFEQFPLSGNFNESGNLMTGLLGSFDLCGTQVGNIASYDGHLVQHGFAHDGMGDGDQFGDLGNWLNDDQFASNDNMFEV